VESCVKQKQDSTSFPGEMPPELRQKAAPGGDEFRVLQEHASIDSRKGNSRKRPPL
jgi:hypothetical protein